MTIAPKPFAGTRLLLSAALHRLTRQWTGQLWKPAQMRSPRQLRADHDGGQSVSRDLDVREITALLGSKRIAKYRPVCVLVDEAQSVSPGTEAGRLFRDLHTRNRLPETLVCLGLDAPHRRPKAAEASPRLTADSRFSLCGHAPGEDIPAVY